MSDKIYFASDFHLGIDALHSSSEREKIIVGWLDEIKKDATAIYLLGDIFDYWFEWDNVIPKGFTRLIGKIAELKDNGIDVVLFTGNHDMWMFDYFQREFDIPIHRRPLSIELQGKKMILGHGDGLGPGDHGYKFIKKVFSNKICQWLFARLHPNLSLWLMKYFSGKSRYHNPAPDKFLGKEKEWLVQYAEQKTKTSDIDYFIFGHRHLPIDYTLSNGHSRYVNLGDWIYYYSYAVLEGGELQLKFYRDDNKVVFP